MNGCKLPAFPACPDYALLEERIKNTEAALLAFVDTAGTTDEEEGSAAGY